MRGRRHGYRVPREQDWVELADEVEIFLMAEEENVAVSTPGHIIDIEESDMENVRDGRLEVEEGVDRRANEDPVEDPDEVTIHLSSRGCSILFGGRERVSLVTEVENQFGVTIEGLDRKKNVSGCVRRVRVKKKMDRGGIRTGNVVEALLKLFDVIPKLAGNNLLYPAIDW